MMLECIHLRDVATCKMSFKLNKCDFINSEFKTKTKDKKLSFYRKYSCYF